MKDVTIAKKYGYQLIIKEYGKNQGRAKKFVRNVGQALIRLEELHDLETDVPLAVFAADITDNPHYFDRGTIPGLRLLTNEGWHPAYESFCSRKEPYVITMENLCGIVGALPAGTQAGQAQSGTILQSGLAQLESVN